MWSVRHEPSTSFRPYSTSVSSPRLHTTHTRSLSKWNFSWPDDCHGTSESLHVSRSPISSVSGVCAIRKRSS